MEFFVFGLAVVVLLLCLSSYRNRLHAEVVEIKLVETREYCNKMLAESDKKWIRLPKPLSMEDIENYLKRKYLLYDKFVAGTDPATMTHSNVSASDMIVYKKMFEAMKPNFNVKLPEETVAGHHVETAINDYEPLKNHLKEGRRKGNTTRLLDHYIQVLFESGEVVLIDHHSKGHDSLLERFKLRMKHEHPSVAWYGQPTEYGTVKVLLGGQ